MAMKRDAWMPLYIGDYLRDTSRLTTEGHGAYLLLIMDYWTAGEPLPDDDTQLAAVTRLPLNRWKALRPTIARFFRIDDGFWHHKRIDEELAKIQQINASRSAAGQRGAEVRWQTHGNGIANVLPCDDGKRMANASAEQWQNDAPSPSPKKKEDSDTDVSDGVVPSDPVKEIYNRGVLIFGEKRRSLLAKMVKRYGDPAVLAAIIETENANPIEPASYFIACCERRQINGSGRGSAESAISKLGAWAMGPDEQESFRGHH